jgi:magnesium chelatase subunit I
MTRPVFPFAAIVGQDDMKLAILIAAIDQGIGGVLAFGDRGTGKSTTIRALAALLPPMKVMPGCRYHCDPASPDTWCTDCRDHGKPKKSLTVPVPVVDLLLDVAASGENVVEREGLSIRHPARFVLIGSGNPEEGELRPQMIDRFGLSVEVRTPQDLPTRMEVIRRRDAFERDPAGFLEHWKKAQDKTRKHIVDGRTRLAKVDVPDAMLERAAKLCMALGTDGLRGELTLIRAARAFAALEGDKEVQDSHLRRIAPMVLSHRLRRNPLDEAVASVRVARALEEQFGA